MSIKQEKRLRRHKKIRKSINGTKDRPRLCVFRSNQHIYAQLIDDSNAKVIFSVSDKNLKDKPASATGCGVAREVGKMVAKMAAENKIDKVVFDRAGVVFHGRIKSLADGAREGGLIF